MYIEPAYLATGAIFILITAYRIGHKDGYEDHQNLIDARTNSDYNRQ